jgi:ribosome recycling factor
MFDKKSHEHKMNEALEHFRNELNKARTGRAHPSMLDGVKVEAYGTFLPLNQTANVTAVEASMILVTPYDPGHITSITAAIRNDQSLGLNPSDDGRVVRVPIPPLTEERRQQIVKQAAEKAEEAKISLRTIRQDAIKDIKQLESDKNISEDDRHRLEKDIDELAKSFQNQIEQAFKDKEAEIMKV